MSSNTVQRVPNACRPLIVPPTHESTTDQVVGRAAVEKQATVAQQVLRVTLRPFPEKTFETMQMDSLNLYFLKQSTVVALGALFSAPVEFGGNENAIQTLQVRLANRIPQSAEQLVSRLVQLTLYQLWTKDPKLGERFALDLIYYNNQDAPLMVDRALSIREVFTQAVQIEANYAHIPKVHLVRIAIARDVRILYGALSAVRRVYGGCYCASHACDNRERTLQDCRSLTSLFGVTETSIQPFTDRLLMSSYHTIDPSSIRKIIQEVQVLKLNQLQLLSTGIGIALR